MQSVWPIGSNAVTSITHKNPNGTQIVQHSYTYDSTNNIVEYLNSIDGSTTYNYDFLGQLIGADYANQNLSDETYTYDENGNRITANGSNYTTGDNNELTSDGTWTYTYDAEGNRISKTNATNRELYTWDHRNRLTTVMQQEWDSVEQDWTTTQIVEYAYDYNNVWIRKVIGTDKTIFIPENYQTTVQIDNNAVTHHYLWMPNQQDKLLADTTPTEVLWSLTDHLGTIRDVLGATSTHLIYDAFGNLTSGTNPLIFGYTGKPFDPATNLQNNINRWYDATIGRWLSTDPIGFHGNDTNLYRYVKNAVQRLFDVLGLASPVDNPILNAQNIRDLFKMSLAWYEFLKDIPAIQIFEQTENCSCSLKWDNGFSGNMEWTNGNFNLTSSFDNHGKFQINSAWVHSGGQITAWFDSNNEYGWKVKMGGPQFDIDALFNGNEYQLNNHVNFPGGQITAWFNSNNEYGGKFTMGGPNFNIEAWLHDKEYQVNSHVNFPGVQITAMVNSDNEYKGLFTIGGSQANMNASINANGYQLDGNLNILGGQLSGNYGSNGYGLGIYIPISDAGQLGGSYQNGQLMLKVVFPIQLPNGINAIIHGEYSDDLWGFGVYLPTFCY